MLLRIIYFIVFLFSGLLFPWWLTLFAGIAGMILFKNYYEALFMGLFLDLLYGGQTLFQTNFSLPFFYSFIFLIFFFLASFLKTKLQIF